MKKIIILLTALLLLSACQKTVEPTKTLKDIYPEIENELKLVESDSKDVMAMLKNGTGVIFLSWKECPWCHYYINLVNEMAIKQDLEVLYYDIYEDREQNSSFYQQVCDVITPYIDQFAYSTSDGLKKAYDSNGKVRIYVPMIIFVSRGEIIGIDYQGSMEADYEKNSEAFWNETNLDGLTRKAVLKLTLNTWGCTVKQVKKEIDESGCQDACKIEE